jgi:translation initiation factor 1
MCPACGRPLAQCACRAGTTARPPGDGVVRVGRQTAGRKGKGVTVVTGVPLAGAELEALATALKRRCGSGGTVRAGVIEIQGDHRDTLVAELAARGWTVKRSGG